MNKTINFTCTACKQPSSNQIAFSQSLNYDADQLQVVVCLTCGQRYQLGELVTKEQYNDLVKPPAIDWQAAEKAYQQQRRETKREAKPKPKQQATKPPIDNKKEERQLRETSNEKEERQLRETERHLRETELKRRQEETRRKLQELRLRENEELEQRRLERLEHLEKRQLDLEKAIEEREQRLIAKIQQRQNAIEERQQRQEAKQLAIAQKKAEQEQARVQQRQQLLEERKHRQETKQLQQKLDRYQKRNEREQVRQQRNSNRDAAINQRRQQRQETTKQLEQRILALYYSMTSKQVANALDISVDVVNNRLQMMRDRGEYVPYKNELNRRFSSQITQNQSLQNDHSFAVPPSDAHDANLCTNNQMVSLSLSQKVPLPETPTPLPPNIPLTPTPLRNHY